MAPYLKLAKPSFERLCALWYVGQGMTKLDQNWCALFWPELPCDVGAKIHVAYYSVLTTYKSY